VNISDIDQQQLHRSWSLLNDIDHTSPNSKVKSIFLKPQFFDDPINLKNKIA
jgi:hypothetical protein